MNTEQPRRLPFLIVIRRFILSIVSISLLLLCCGWLLSGYLIRAQLEDELKPLNLIIKQQGKISLNPFMGKLSIKNVVMYSEGDNVEQLNIEKADVDVNLVNLFSKNISFDAFVLEGVNLRVVMESADNLVIAGFSTKNNQQEEGNDSESAPVLEEPNNVWTIDLKNSDINNIAIDFDDGFIAHQVVIERLDIESAAISTLSQSIDVDVLGSINKAKLIAHTNVNIAGGVGSIKTDINLSDFTFEKLSHLLPVNVSKLSGSSALDTQIVVDITETATSMTIDALEFTTHNLMLDLEVFKSTLDDLTVSGRNISVVVLEEADVQSSDISFNAELELSLANYMAYHHENDSELLSLSKFISTPLSVSYRSGDIQLTSDKLSFDGLTIANSVAENKKDLTLLDVKNISLNKLSLSPLKLVIDNINIGAINSNVILDKEQRLSNGPDLSAFIEKGTEQPSKESIVEINSASEYESIEEQSFIFDIGNISLIEPASFYYRDNSFKSRFERRIKIPELNVISLSNASFDHESQYSVSANIEHHASLQMSGTIKPFTQKNNLSIKAKLNELSLPNVSAYMGNIAGIEFLSGQLDSDIDLTITDDQLSGTTKLFMRGLTLSGSEEESSSLGQGSTVSLNTALNMLKDSNDNLELDVPLSGDISSPSFGWGSFISIVTQKALMAASETYLIQTFVPYANIISVARVAGQFMLKVNIEDLVYQPEQTALASEQNDFIDELVRVLEDKKEVQLKACPIAVISEVDENNSEHGQIGKDIAEERGRLFKQWLIEEKQIQSKRILICSPSIDRNAGAKPRIEFSVESML